VPIYEFKCPLCGIQFESISKPWDPVRCTRCGCIELEQIFGVPNLTGITPESKEMKRREGKRERVMGMIEKQSGKKLKYE
jgi:putative FmdB family regulatory protein